MKNWIHERITWLDLNMPGNCMNDVIAKIPKQEKNIFFHVFPNPASNNLTVDLEDLNGVNTTINLYDSSGKLVFEKKSNSKLIIDVSGFSKGIYSLEISNNEHLIRRQVIIK